MMPNEVEEWVEIPELERRLACAENVLEALRIHELKEVTPEQQEQVASANLKSHRIP